MPFAIRVLGVVEKEETEIEERAGDRLAVDQKMLFGQMPAARADHQGGRVLAELVCFPSGLV